MKDLNSFWIKYIEVMNSAKEYGLKSNNILGEYTEQLSSSVLDLKLIKRNNTGFDATDSQGKRVQIKGRRIRTGNSAKLTTLWNLEFDYIIAVVYYEDGTINFVQKIEKDAVVRDFKIDPKKNCRRVIANKEKSGTDGYSDLTEIFRNYINFSQV